jgi:hypothetical protein
LRGGRRFYKTFRGSEVLFYGLCFIKIEISLSLVENEKTRLKKIPDWLKVGRKSVKNSFSNNGKPAIPLKDLAKNSDVSIYVK